MSKNISANTINKISKEGMTTKTVDFHGYELVIKNAISLSEMLGFVESAVSTCFQNNDKYYPEILPLAINSNLVTYYTNINMPNDASKRYDILYNTDIIDVIISNINSDQIGDIIKSISKKLDDRVKVSRDYMSQTISLISTIGEDIVGMLKEKFKSVSSDDISKIASFITSDNKFDEARFAEAYLSAKQNNSK